VVSADAEASKAILFGCCDDISKLLVMNYTNEV